MIKNRKIWKGERRKRGREREKDNAEFEDEGFRLPQRFELLGQNAIWSTLPAGAICECDTHTHTQLDVCVCA